LASPQALEEAAQVTEAPRQRSIVQKQAGWLEEGGALTAQSVVDGGVPREEEPFADERRECLGGLSAWPAALRANG